MDDADWDDPRANQGRSEDKTKILRKSRGFRLAIGQKRHKIGRSVTILPRRNSK